MPQRMRRMWKPTCRIVQSDLGSIGASNHTVKFLYRRTAHMNTGPGTNPNPNETFRQDRKPGGTTYRPDKSRLQQNNSRPPNRPHARPARPASRPSHPVRRPGRLGRGSAPRGAGRPRGHQELVQSECPTPALRPLPKPVHRAAAS